MPEGFEDLTLESEESNMISISREVLEGMVNALRQPDYVKYSPDDDMTKRAYATSRKVRESVASEIAEIMAV